MATPHAAGVAALIKSNDSTLVDKDPDLDKKIKDKLLQSLDLTGLEGKTVSGGRLSAARAVGITTVSQSPLKTTSPLDTYRHESEHWHHRYHHVLEGHRPDHAEDPPKCEADLHAAQEWKHTGKRDGKSMTRRLGRPR